MLSDQPQTFEELCAEVHGLYQAEIARQGRPSAHNDDYYALPEPVKELDRVFVRWHLQRLDAAIASQQAEIMELNDLLDAVARERDELRVQLAEAKAEIERLKSPTLNAADNRAVAVPPESLPCGCPTSGHEPFCDIGRYDREKRYEAVVEAARRFFAPDAPLSYSSPVFTHLMRRLRAALAALEEK